MQPVAAAPRGCWEPPGCIADRVENNNAYSPPKADLGNASPGQHVTSDPDLASRWARLGAYIVDVILIALLYAVAFYGTDYWDRVMQQTISFAEQMLSVLFGCVVYLLINGYLLHKRGQSIGKWVLGVKIVTAGDNAILPLWEVFFAALCFEGICSNNTDCWPIPGFY